jgi:hypothetical protein
MINSTNFGLKKPEPQVDNVNIDTINGNMDTIDTALGNTAIFETAGGTATAITLKGIVLENGRSKTFVVALNNNGADTTINGKSLYKPGTTEVPKLTAGKAVTVWYNGANFFIKASAEGDVAAENVLAPYKFSNEDDTGIVGTMVDNGPSVATTVNLTTEGAEYTIPKGYHSGLRKIKAIITGLIASVIKAGVTVGGILGTFTADATAVDGDVLIGKTYYRNGVKGIGNITAFTSGLVDLTNAVVTAVNGQVAFWPQGYFNGNAHCYINDADFLASNILATKNIFGLQGSIPVRTGANYEADDVYSGGGYIYLKPQTGSYSPEGFSNNPGQIGGWVTANDPDFVPSKIPSDVNLFGLQGSRALGKLFASGTKNTNASASGFTLTGGITLNAYGLVVSGLSFTPKVIVLMQSNTMTVYNEINNPSRVIMTQFPSNGQQSIVVFNVAITGVASVTSGGFTLPSYNPNEPTSWWAYE